ncbi:MAG: hypothetical protein ACTHMJ_05860 [Thermomicrobiales bacterium]|jgi:hypothetical protein|nr:hypothetical protein [Thermomicrobiales bacterium]
MRYYLLPVEQGETISDAGESVVWMACSVLPGAYEEAPTLDAAREQLRALAVHIIAEHLLRDDPLDPAIAVTDLPPHPTADLLTVPVGDADLEVVRQAPLLMIEQPEP